MLPKPQKYPNSLRRHRKNSGLRQREVAHALKLNTCERISKWENGHSVPALSSLFRLAALYRVSPQELFDEMYRATLNPSSPAPEPVSEPGMSAVG
jgi:transcriptional regulator with XRE-family HTH domain